MSGTLATKGRCLLFQAGENLSRSFRASHFDDTSVVFPSRRFSSSVSAVTILALNEIDRYHGTVLRKAATVTPRRSTTGLERFQEAFFRIINRLAGCLHLLYSRFPGSRVSDETDSDHQSLSPGAITHILARLVNDKLSSLLWPAGRRRQQDRRRRSRRHQSRQGRADGYTILIADPRSF